MEALIVSPELLLALFGVALIAGCLDTLVGGGGLIVLPELVLAGIPPLQALGTNKLQGTVGTATASLMMLRHGKVKWAKVKVLMAWAFAGSALGSLIVQLVDTSFLRFMIPLVLVVVAMVHNHLLQLLQQQVQLILEVEVVVVVLMIP